jgi:predicted Zn-dependent protease
MVVSRDSIETKTTITPVKACDFGVHLAPDDVKNAYADGKNVVVYKGMMDFFKTDEEIALVLSHELAHNSMKHIDAKQKNAIVGGIFGLLLDIAAAGAGVNTNGEFAKAGAGIAGNTYSVAFEQEADYVGLYFMKKADYDIQHAADFWRRMAVSNSQAITIKSTHPTTPERFVAIEATVGEIKTKIANGEPLTPELKSKPKLETQPEAGSLPEVEAAPEDQVEPLPI